MKKNIKNIGANYKENTDDFSATGQKEHKIKIRFIILVAVLFVIVAFLILNRDHLTPMKFSEWVSDVFVRIGSGKGYPYDLNDETVLDVAPFESDVVILTDTSLTVLTPSAKPVTSRQITYSNPAVSCSRDRILVYDIGGNEFSVQNRSSVLYNGKSSYSISTCAIGDYGNFVIAAKDEVYSNVVTFYSYSFDEIFKWSSGNSYVITMSLSPDGKYGAVSVLNAKSGDKYSEIYIFNLKNSQVISHRFDGELITELTFSKNNSIIAVGSSAVFSIDNPNDSQCTPEKFRFSGDVSCVSAVSKNSVAVISNVYKNNEIYMVTYVNEKQGSSFSKELSCVVYDICASDSICSVLTQDSILIFDINGNLLREVNFSDIGINSEVHRVIICNSDIYALTSFELIHINYI